MHSGSRLGGRSSARVAHRTPLDSTRRLLLGVVVGVVILSGAVDPTMAVTFSHDDWTTVLHDFVDESGRVNYGGLAADREVFDRYIRSIEALSPVAHPDRFPTRNEALAYYINAYNAHVFDAVLDRGPESRSVWRGLISGFTFFVRTRIVVGGKSMSLRSLENRLIRAAFRDPRVHAALNCASISCPRLRREAFDPARLEAQLDEAMAEFVSDPRHCRVDPDANSVQLSRIFDWFSKDFLDHERSQGNRRPRLLDYVNRFRAGGAEIPRDVAVRFLDYDKGINSQ
jgi:hypothetical protein